MKRFLKNIGFFGLILLIGAFGLEYYFTHKLLNRNAEGEIIVWKDVYENNLKEYDHFIYGSSPGLGTFRSRYFGEKIK